MHLDKSHSSNIYVLILACRADSLCTVLPAFLREYEYNCTICLSIYEVLIRLGVSEMQGPAVLITRPSMLSAEALAYLCLQYPELHIIGWLERNENLSDFPFGANGEHIMMTGGLKQLAQMLKTLSRLYNIRDNQPPKPMRILEHVRDVLTQEEVNALLGAG